MKVDEKILIIQNLKEPLQPSLVDIMTAEWRVETMMILLQTLPVQIVMDLGFEENL
jgi:hypothetical protein